MISRTGDRPQPSITLQFKGFAPIGMMESWNIGKMGFALRLVEFTLSPGCWLYKQEADLQAYWLEAGSERIL